MTNVCVTVPYNVTGPIFYHLKKKKKNFFCSCLAHICPVGCGKLWNPSSPVNSTSFFPSCLFPVWCPICLWWCVPSSSCPQWWGDILSSVLLFTLFPRWSCITDTLSPLHCLCSPSPCCGSRTFIGWTQILQIWNVVQFIFDPDFFLFSLGLYISKNAVFSLSDWMC